jgi:hypothetical protein
VRVPSGSVPSFPWGGTRCAPFAGMERHGSLEIPEDIAFERRAWKVQRVGWVLMSVTLIAAVAGVFGDGPLAKAEATADGVGVKYDRFVRSGGETELKLRLEPGRGDEVEGWLGREYLERFELVDVLPEPERVATDPERVRMTFRAGTPGEAVHVRIRAKPRASGRLHGEVGLEHGGAVRFTQVSYP